METITREVLTESLELSKPQRLALAAALAKTRDIKEYSEAELDQVLDFAEKAKSYSAILAGILNGIFALSIENGKIMFKFESKEEE